MDQKNTFKHSIFNDVLGPIMNGPSSSHCAGCCRIGKTARNLYEKEICKVDIILERKGSYPNTYRGQGSAYGFIGGLLGMETGDPRVRDSESIANIKGMKYRFLEGDLGFHHPNEAEIIIYNEMNEVEMSLLTYSIGGGNFEIRKMDGFDIYIDGSRQQSFICCGDEITAKQVKNIIMSTEEWDDESLGIEKRAILKKKENSQSVLICISGLLSRTCRHQVEMIEEVLYIREDHGVLPLSDQGKKALFITAEDALGKCMESRKQLWKIALEHEKHYGGVTEEEIQKKLDQIIKVMENSMIPPNPEKEAIYGFRKYIGTDLIESKKTAKIVNTGLLNDAAIHAVAVMENNCAHKVICAAPTAGSSGVIPATVIGIGRSLGASEEEIRRALLTAGAVGLFIINQSTFAGEEGACQAEMGSACAMASGAVAYLLGGGPEQSMAAASLALQNMLGLVCDPVAGLTEIPCIGRNVAAVSGAIISANMVMLGFNPVIPLDETIQAMKEIGDVLSPDLCCTCRGGLCMTKTGKKLAKYCSEK